MMSSAGTSAASRRQARRRAAQAQRKRWSVYRISYADGAAYVGQTGRSVSGRVAEHLASTPSIRQRSLVGLSADVEVLAQGLTRRQALRRERREIARLRRPLNIVGPTRSWKDPVVSKNPRRRYKAIEAVQQAESRASDAEQRHVVRQRQGEERSAHGERKRVIRRQRRGDSTRKERAMQRRNRDAEERQQLVNHLRRVTSPGLESNARQSPVLSRDHAVKR